MVSQQSEGPRGPTAPPRKDFWDILDILLKGVLAVTVSAGVAFFSITSEGKREDRANEDRKAQTRIQMVNARETAASSLRSNMFDTLLSLFFDKESDESQVMVLELIGLNFRDAIQIKPMFEQLDRKLKAERDWENRKRLRDAASTIVQDQLKQVEIAREGSVRREWIKPSDGPKTFDASLKLRLLSMGDGEIRVATNTIGGVLLDDGDANGDGVEDWLEDGSHFWVSYFDMPMIDYTYVWRGDEILRYSVVLIRADQDTEQAAPDSVQIAVAILPRSSYSGGQHYQFDELLDGTLSERFEDGR